MRRAGRIGKDAPPVALGRDIPAGHFSPAGSDACPELASGRETTSRTRHRDTDRIVCTASAAGGQNAGSPQ